MPRRSRGGGRSIRPLVGGGVRRWKRRRPHRSNPPAHWQLREVPYGAYGPQRHCKHRAYILFLQLKLPSPSSTTCRYPTVHVLGPRYSRVRLRVLPGARPVLTPSQ